MKSAHQPFGHLAQQGKPCEGRIAPARMARLAQMQGTSFLYDQDRWTGLNPRIANAYVRFEDKTKHAIRERITL